MRINDKVFVEMAEQSKAAFDDYVEPYITGITGSIGLGRTDDYYEYLRGWYGEDAAQEWLANLKPEQLLFNGPATIVISPLGKKTVVKCANRDRFSARYGYLLAKFIESSGLSHRAAEKRLKEVDEAYQDLLVKALSKMMKS